MRASDTTTRTKRINIRVTEAQAHLLRQAAQQASSNVSSFLVESACLRAEEALASQRYFFYTEEQWTAFAKALDAPPTHNPELRKLLTEPGVLDRK